MKAFHTEDLALVKHVAIVSDYTVTALNPEEPKNSESRIKQINLITLIFGSIAIAKCIRTDIKNRE